MIRREIFRRSLGALASLPSLKYGRGVGQGTRLLEGQIATLQAYKAGGVLHTLIPLLQSKQRDKLGLGVIYFDCRGLFTEENTYP